MGEPIKITKWILSSAHLHHLGRTKKCIKYQRVKLNGLALFYRIGIPPFSVGTLMVHLKFARLIKPELFAGFFESE